MASAAHSPFVSPPVPKQTSLSSLALPSGLSLSGLSSSQIASSALVLVVTLLLLEQTLWRYRKGKLPGWKWQIPVIGQFLDSLHPSMEAYKKTWAEPMMAVSVFNIFIVMASTTDLSRRILNSSTYTEPCLVRSAKQVLDPTNWVFLNGKVHNEYRKGLNCLFTRQALSIYLKTQDRIYRKFFAEWLADKSPEHKPYTMIFRDLNMETSLRVFCGSYIKQENVQEITEKYWQITKALELVNFPFAFPGSKVWNACRARASTVKYLTAAAAASKKAVAAGKEPDCLLDAWVQQILQAKAWRERTDDSDAERPNLILREYADYEMALVLLSFIFASQDAMSSSITFAFQHLADHPEVLAKVREEQQRVRGDSEIPITLDLLDEMPYINAVTKEVLRHRPPVIMVPYLTKKDFPLTEDYTVPKGTMLIPSFWNSLHDPAVYPEPEEFKPERWLPGGANAVETEEMQKNWLVFGAGAHRCIAQSYVFMHMSAVLGSAAMMMDWTHEKTPDSDNIQIIATLFPKDGARLKFTPRQA